MAKLYFMQRNYGKKSNLFSIVVSVLFVIIISPYYSSAGVFPHSSASRDISGKSMNNKYLSGKIINSVTGEPVFFAEIHNTDNTIDVRSNMSGEFVIGPFSHPLILYVKRFGFKKEMITVSETADSCLISLEPVKINKSYSGPYKLLQYDQIFRRAIEKAKISGEVKPTEESGRGLVYRRITSCIDSSLMSLYEAYAQMKIGTVRLWDYSPVIARYAADVNTLPGLEDPKLELDAGQYLNLPMFPQRYITRKAFLVDEERQVAVITISLDNTKTTYFINVQDTSLIFLSSHYLNGKRTRIQSINATIRDSEIKTEMSFSEDLKNAGRKTLQWASEQRKYRLKMKNGPERIVSRISVCSLVPDSSVIRMNVNDAASNEVLKEMKLQLNYKANYSVTGESTAFKTQIESLLSKPYQRKFWIHNSYVNPDLKELKQISVWEASGNFHSDASQSSLSRPSCADSLADEMNRNLVAIENVFIQTDRSEYFAGDTIWFSAFVLDNLSMDSTSLSRILYVDLINSDNVPEKRLKCLVENGRTDGDFVLEKDVKEGVFRIRSYTRYMQNFQSDYLFEKDIPVHQSDFRKIVLVNPLIRKGVSGDSVELFIKTIVPDDIMFQDPALDVIARINDTINVKKSFRINKSLNDWIGFFVPSSLNCKSVDVRFILSGSKIISEQRLTIPLKSGLKLQFFPESGKIIAGLKNVIAFKATDERGNPKEFTADIVDDNGNRVTNIRGGRTGTGKFELDAGNNHSYTAIAKIEGNSWSFSLPEVEPEGYLMNYNPDSCDIIIRNNLGNIKSRHYLLTSVRGEVYGAHEIMLDNMPFYIHLPLRLFPKGIIQVTLFDEMLRPLAERLVFNNRGDKKLKIDISTDKEEYDRKDLVTIALRTTDAGGNPVSASLALAVTDASKTDTLNKNIDIETYLYLASELKSRIDKDLLTLSDTSAESVNGIDLLMMTQGWRNYLWNSIKYRKTLDKIHPAEKGLNIEGLAYDLNNQQLRKRYNLIYFDFKTGYNGTARIDSGGKFRINLPLFYNSHVYYIQNETEKGRIDKLGFMLDTFRIPLVKYRNNELPFHSYRTASMEVLEKKFIDSDTSKLVTGKVIDLPEVKVIARADRSGYSSPDISIDLEKKDPTGKKYSSIFQLIYEEFGEKAFAAVGFGVNGKIYNPILVVNGAPLTASLCPPCYDFVAYGWASAIPVNEIYDVKFYEAKSKYSQWLSPPPPGPTMVKGLYIVGGEPKIYLPVVSIRTYSNSYRGYAPGSMFFSLQGIYAHREFYQPDYEIIDKDIPDDRITIYWNPDIRTGPDGRAFLSFYNSGLKGKAEIRVAGVSYSLRDAGSSEGAYVSR